MGWRSEELELVSSGDTTGGDEASSGLETDSLLAAFLSCICCSSVGFRGLSGVIIAGEAVVFRAVTVGWRTVRKIGWAWPAVELEAALGKNAAKSIN